MRPVRNHRNPIVVDAARLHNVKHRRERGETLLEGPHQLLDAIAAGASLSSLFALENDERAEDLAASANIELTLVDEKALQRLADTESPRGPVAAVQITESPVPQGRDVLVAWGLSDPGNVGTLIRTAAAFEWGFAYGPDTADPWSPKAMRSAAAAQFQTTVSRIGSLDDLKSHVTVASIVEGGSEVDDVGDGMVALLIGGEAHGLPRSVAERVRHSVTITTPGPTESLNAAMAAGILVYALSKRGLSGHPV
jgi:TrmH family RNA methyltransferase